MIDMNNLSKITHHVMNSNHELKAKCGLLEIENNELKAKYGLLEMENNQLKSVNMELEDYLARLEEENINLKKKLEFFTHLMEGYMR